MNINERQDAQRLLNKNREMLYDLIARANYCLRVIDELEFRYDTNTQKKKIKSATNPPTYLKRTKTK